MAFILLFSATSHDKTTLVSGRETSCRMTWGGWADHSEANTFKIRFASTIRFISTGKILGRPDQRSNGNQCLFQARGDMGAQVGLTRAYAAGSSPDSGCHSRSSPVTVPSR